MSGQERQALLANPGAKVINLMVGRSHDGKPLYLEAGIQRDVGTGSADFDVAEYKRNGGKVPDWVASLTAT